MGERPQRGERRGSVGRRLFSDSFLSVLEAVAFAIGFEDMDPVGEPIQEGAGEAFAAHDFGPFLEGQVGGDDHRTALIGLADDIEKQFRARFGERDVAELVEDDQIQSLKLARQALERSAFLGFEELGDQAGGGEEAHALALATGGKAQGRAGMASFRHGALYRARAVQCRAVAKTFLGPERRVGS